MLETALHFGNDAIPVIATAIHSGHKMPPALISNCGISAPDRLREEDPHTGEIAALFPNHISVETSRFAIDLNRNAYKAIYLNPEDCWGLPVRSHPIPEDVLARLRADYDSWYALIRYQIERLLKSHPFLIVLDLHSYNHRRGGAAAEPDPQSQNPDIILGRSNLRDVHYPAVHSLHELLNGQLYLGKELDCRVDIKFTGGNFSRWLNHHFPDQLLCLAIEFKKIWMDEWSGAVDTAAFRDLQKLFFQTIRTWLDQVYQINL